MSWTRSRGLGRPSLLLWPLLLALVLATALPGAAVPTTGVPTATSPGSSCAKCSAFTVTLYLSALEIDAPGNVTATAEPSIGGSFQYLFSWGDGSENTTPQPSLTHHYASAPSPEPVTVSVVATDTGTGDNANASDLLTINGPLSVTLVPVTPVNGVTFSPPFWENFSLLVGGATPPYYTNWTWGDGTTTTFVPMPNGTTSLVVEHDYAKGRSSPYVLSVSISDQLHTTTVVTLSLSVVTPSKGPSGVNALLSGTTLYIIVGAVVVVVLLIVVVVVLRRRKAAPKAEAPATGDEGGAGAAPAPTTEPDLGSSPAPELPMPRDDSPPAPVTAAALDHGLPVPDRYVPPPVPQPGSARTTASTATPNPSRAIFAPSADHCPICGTELASPHAPCPLCTPSLVPTPTTPDYLDLPPLPGLEAPASTAAPLRPPTTPLSPAPTSAPPVPEAPWSPPAAFAQTAPPKDLPPSAPRPTAPAPSPFVKSPAPTTGPSTLGRGTSVPPSSPSNMGMGSEPKPSSSAPITRSATCLVCGSALQTDGTCPSCGMRWSD